jgi:hypothetical protein
MTTAPSIAKEAVRTISARAKQHGDILATFQNIASVWNGILIASGKAGEPLDAHDVANLMEGLKIARRYTGAFNLDDYVDGAGYAAVAGEIRGGDK